jgi:hypothetical protein
MSNKDDIDRLESRLINCQYLEKKYLDKHEELMNTFRFTILLFKKYNNSTSLNKYLLEYLNEVDKTLYGEGTSKGPNVCKSHDDVDTIIEVKKNLIDTEIRNMQPNEIIRYVDRVLIETGNEIKAKIECPAVVLPKTILRDFSGMLRDQEQIKGTIRQMEAAVNDKNNNDPLLPSSINKSSTPILKSSLTSSLTSKNYRL